MAEATPIKAHRWAREENEHYVDPAWCSARLFEEEYFSGSIWDPCCGFGTIVKEARKAGICAVGSDLVDRGFGYAGYNFMTSVSLADNIVCNPPFAIADRFAERALKLATRKVALIFPTARLNAAHWLRGKPLMRVWLMTPRPSMPPGHVIARGEKPAGGKMDYCWLVFDRDHRGPAELRWLRRDE